MVSKRRYFYNVIILAIAILWPLFQSIFLNGFDGAGRVQILLSITAILVNGKHLFDTPKVIHIWLLWIVYGVINTYVKGFNYESSPFPLWVHQRLIFPYIIMLVAYHAVSFDRKKTFYYLFIFYLFYTIIGVFNITAEDAYDVGVRYYNELGNHYFNTIVLLMTFTSLLFVSKRIKIIPFIAVIGFLSYLMILSGERKGLIALFIIITGAYIAINGGKSMRSFVSYFAFAVMAFLLLNYIMDNTTFGLRMSHSIENTEFRGNWFLTLMGDRSIQYYDGWLYFLQNPWTGIGLRKYAEVNSYWEGGVFHTEYMVQLVECGIIGSIMFLIFYFEMIKRLFSKFMNKDISPVLIIFRATLIAIITINFVAWTYDNSNYFMLFGVINAFCEKGMTLKKAKPCNN